MRTVFYLMVSFLVTFPAFAAEKEFDLGYARVGMMMGQFRFGAWPAGLSVRCGDDVDRPKSLDKMLALPRQLADAGGVRCALLQGDGESWSLATRKVAGSPTQLNATFGPDTDGVRRLVQLYLTFPRTGFDGMVEHFTSRFGPPTETSERLVRWNNGKAEALIMHEGDDSAMAMLVDLRLQNMMNAKVQSGYKCK